ncbi:hypothetical protein ACWGDX_13245 [Streptomyces sp. NPDC055025]
MFGKSDKRCAQIAVAAAAVGKTDQTAQLLIKETLTPEEMERATEYIKSGQTLLGR